MEKYMLVSTVLPYFRTVVLLLVVICSCPGVGPTPAASGAVHTPEDFSRRSFGSIFSPLLKALEEHGGSRWNPGMRRKMKPEHRYIKYLTEVFKKSRLQSSLDGTETYNTVRLMKPQDECLAQSNKESFTQGVSYSLDQIRKKEELLKSTLLYSFDPDDAASFNSVCFLSIKEQEHSNQCQLCPEVHLAVNFTANVDQWNGRNWVEVDMTRFLMPLLKFQKNKIHLFINVTCPEEQIVRADGHRGTMEFTLRSPPLLLYLSDTGKIVHQKLLSSTKADQKPTTAADKPHKQVIFKAKHRTGHKSRWKRESPKSKRGDKSLDSHLPELLSSSEFPTTDCALYDFRVRFSQLKLDHWIVFPPKYNPRYCKGICPRTMGFIYGSPVHTMVQNIIYEKLDSSVPRPSCIPSHYSPLSVMIFEEDGSYVYKEFEDMVATRCTCR
ncbi:growth/differentiatio [Sphaeramia orbicularis]|uniref:Growth/differentiation factor 9-like n=1 Tax=Sphaeramia orbicularis TaxID=375764 RepID=A0A673BXN9_9TELE|nr:growth/differentiation factor 9-like [Sphaeramia orbicularis]